MPRKDPKARAAYNAEYQRNRYANDPEYRERVKANAKRRYHEKMQDPAYRESERERNRRQYAKGWKKYLIYINRNERLNAKDQEVLSGRPQTEA